MNNNFIKTKSPLILALLFFILSCTAFYVLYNKTKSNTLVFQQAQTEWQTEAAKKEEVQALDRLLKNSEADIALLDTHFIKGADVVPFLDSIEKLAREAKTEAEVTVVDLAPDHSSLSVGVRAQGTFENLYKFLRLLENSPYKLEFTVVDMDKLGGVIVIRKGVQVPEWSAVFKVKLLSFVN